jgi:hypothetical protein
MLLRFSLTTNAHKSYINGHQKIGTRNYPELTVTRGARISEFRIQALESFGSGLVTLTLGRNKQLGCPYSISTGYLSRKCGCIFALDHRQSLSRMRLGSEWRLCEYP